MTRPIATTALFLLAALCWAGLAATRGPWTADAGAVVAADLVVLASISVVGILVASSRWGRRLAIAVTLAGLGIAATTPVEGVWWVGIGLSGSALALLAGLGLDGVVRKRPNAAGPPPKAVVLALGLAALPGVLAAARPNGLDVLDWAAVGGAAAIALWYSRALPAAPEVTRFGVPVTGVVAFLSAGTPAGLIGLVASAVLTGLAWTADARVAVRPLTEPGRAVPIPAELTPPEILDAAGLDEHGRRRNPG